MRILILIILSLVVSAVAIAAIGISVFVEDKGAYFMDYNLTQVRLAADSVDHQIQKVLWMSKLIATQMHSGDKKATTKLFDDATRTSRLKRLLVLNVSKDGLLRT